MSYLTDYHVHTNYSDGTMRPVDLVKKFKDDGYDLIAITDHDTVGGIMEAEIAGEAVELKVIPGIEISAKIDVDGQDSEVHILGYHIDPKNKELLETCEKLLQYRRDRNNLVVKKLEEMGYELKLEELIKVPGVDFVGKPDFVRAFEEKGIKMEDPWEFLASIPKTRITAQEAINVIRAAGGIAVLAHPMKIRELRPQEEGFFERLDPVVRELRKGGLKGMECYHPSADDDDSLKLVQVAGKYHLHITKGSDFHG